MDVVMNDHENDDEKNTEKIQDIKSEDDTLKNVESKQNEHLLEIGMLPHHELENVSMNEKEIIKQCKPGWSNCDGTTFKVRIGPNYVRGSGQKAPSKPALYKMF